MGLGGEESGAEAISVAVVDGDEITVSGGGGDSSDHLAENRGMELGIAELHPGEIAFVREGRHASHGCGAVGSGRGVVGGGA